jgi:hypothetical protein
MYKSLVKTTSNLPVGGVDAGSWRAKSCVLLCIVLAQYSVYVLQVQSSQTQIPAEHGVTLTRDKTQIYVVRSRSTDPRFFYAVVLV